MENIKANDTGCLVNITEILSLEKKKSKGGTTLEKVNHIFVLILLFVFFVAFGIIIYYKRL